MTIPFTIAHRAGNDYEALERALASGVDAVEIDVRLDRGRLAGRHDARLFHLPIYGARWYIRFSLGRESMLDEVLRRAEGKVALLVDVKNGDAHSLRLLLETLRVRRAIAGTLVSSGFWDLMRMARASERDLRVYHSIGNAKELRRLWERQQATNQAKGVSIKDGLLDKGLIERFLAGGVEIAAYNVYDLARARQLVDWGVAIIISGDLSLLRALKEPASL